jgi:O-antigen/teichoic acid export membrane protein
MGLLVAGGGWVAYQASEFLMGLFQERLRQDLAALAEAVGAAVTFAGVFLLSRTGGSIHGMLGATALGFGATFLCSLLGARRLVRFRLHFDGAEWRGLIRSGLPIAASSALLLVLLRGDVLLLAYFTSPREVGVYDIAVKIYEISTTFSYLFGGLILPLLTRDYAEDPERFAGRLGGAAAALMAVAAALLVLLTSCAREVVVLLAGGGFAETARPLRLVAVAIGFAAPAFALRFAAVAAGRQSHMLRVDLVAVVIGIGAYAALIPKWSYVGAAIGKCAADLTILIGAAALACNAGALKSNRRVALEIALAGAVMAAVLWGLGRSGAPWILAAGAGILVYLAVLWPMPGLRRQLRRLVAE